MMNGGGINNGFPNTFTVVQSLMSQYAMCFHLSGFVEDRCHTITQRDVAQPKGLGQAEWNNAWFIVAEIIEVGWNTWQCFHVADP